MASSRRSPGRTFKRPDQATQDAILEALRMGNTRKVSANSIEVSEETFKTWMALIPAFRTAVEKAEAEAEMTMVSVLRENAVTWNRWQPALNWLSRRKPMDWGEIQRFEVYQKIEEIRELQEELSHEGINVPMSQLVADYNRLTQSQKGSSRSRRTTIKALPAPPSESQSAS